MIDDKTILIAEFGTKGVKRAYAAVTTITDGKLAAEVFQATGLALRLDNDSLREHFDVNAATHDAKPLPMGENDVYACVCGETFTSTYAATRHVELDHLTEQARRDLDNVEDVIEALIFPNPLPAAPEPTEIIKDRTFGTELTKELSTVFTNLNIGDEKSATDLVEYCGWDQVAGLNYDEVKVHILDEVGGKKIQPPMHEVFLTAMALFLSQVGRLSKKYGSKK
jgi:hypothetical protein